MGSFDGKNGGKKSRATGPLSMAKSTPDKHEHGHRYCTEWNQNQT